MKHSLLVIFIFFFCWSNALSQNIEPPVLNCVRNSGDNAILSYDLAPNPGCGAIEGYRVYISNTGRDNPNYSLLSTITDVASLTATITDAGQINGVNHIFLRTFACGQESSPSDTLDNITPKRPVDISHVTVNAAGQIELFWEIENDPEIGGYRIFVDNTATRLDEILGNGISSYVDTVTDPTTGPHTYYIRSLDICESGGPAAVESPIIAGAGFFPHTTIFLETTDTDACDRSIGIKWNAYDNSPNDILNYEVFVSVNGGLENTIEVVNKNNLSTRIPNLIDGSTITIRVAANLTNGPRAFSNQITEVIDVTAKPEGGYIRNASVIDGVLIVEYIEDVEGVVVDKDLVSSINGENFSNPGAILIAQNPPKYEDRSGDPNVAAYYYEVIRRDQCGATESTGTVRTILAQSRQISDETIEVFWNPFEIAHGEVTGYIVERIKDGVVDQTFPFNAQETSFVDDGVLNQDSLIQFCYVVRATYDITAPVAGATTETGLESQSNITCFQLKPSVFVPSIFNPLSTINENRSIRPFVKFGSPEGFTFMIFNRWGELMYMTEDINDSGWTGDDAPMESYVYYVKFFAQDGQPIEQNGTFVLMR